MTFFSEYNKLKNNVLRAAVSTDRQYDLLCCLKKIFGDNINSPRRFESITSIGKLLKVLEIRDVLSESDVNPLKIIAREIPNNKELLRQIDYYEQHYMPTNSNYYATSTLKTPPKEQKKLCSKIHSDDNWNRNKELIIKAVIENIGTYWRDLARNLDIKEKYINEIHNKYNKIELKAQFIIDLYFSQADQHNWFFELCEALESSRRKDLVRKLKKIAVMNL